MVWTHIPIWMHSKYVPIIKIFSTYGYKIQKSHTKYLYYELCSNGSMGIIAHKDFLI